MSSSLYRLTLVLVLALVLAGCEREHSNVYKTDTGDEEQAKDDGQQDGGDDSGHDNGYDEPYPADDDEKTGEALLVAERLVGTWRGTMDYFYYDPYGLPNSGVCTTVMTYRQYEKNTLNGTGRESDYDESGKLVNNDPFTWYVDADDCKIHMRFDEREMTSVTYQVNDTLLSLTLANSTGLETDIFLLHRQ